MMPPESVAVKPYSWEDVNGPRGAINTLEGLTHTSGTSRGGLGMKPTRLKRRALSGSTRQAIARRAGCEPGSEVSARCAYCGRSGYIYWPLRIDGRPGAWVTLRGLEFDHVLPVSRGGGNGPENIALACQRCNRSKGARV